MFGLHVFPFPAGTIVYRSGPLMASADDFTIEIKGRQTHGAVPWGGVDPIVIGSQIVIGAADDRQRARSTSRGAGGRDRGPLHRRQSLEHHPGRSRARRHDARVRRRRAARTSRIASAASRRNFAEAAGATATVEFGLGYPGDEERSGADREDGADAAARRGRRATSASARSTGTAEDFSYFQQKVPGLFFFLGVTPRGQDHTKAPANHSPLFFADESALPVGVRVMTNLALDYLHSKKPAEVHVPDAPDVIDLSAGRSRRRSVSRTSRPLRPPARRKPWRRARRGR